MIAAGDLAELLIAAEQTVTAIARREHPDTGENLVVGLAEIQDASIGFCFTSNQPEIVAAAYQEFVAAVENRLFRSLPGRSLEALRTLTQFARERKGHTQFWNGTQNGPLLDLPSDYAVQVPQPDYQRGETVVYGKVERVGGVRPRVRLRVSSREVIYGDISEEQSRILGGKLYGDTALRGHATWDAQDGSIVYFRVDEILQYERVPVATAFEELRTAAAGAFDVIEDVDLFATRVREGDAP